MALCTVRLRQVVLQMVQMVSLLLLLLLLHVKVSSQVLARLCCSMLRMTLGQMKHTWLVLLRAHLRRAVAIRGPNYRAHEGVCGEEAASAFRINHRHDSRGRWRQLSHHHLAVVWCFHVHVAYSGS